MNRIAKAGIAGALALVTTGCAKPRASVPRPPLDFKRVSIKAGGPEAVHYVYQRFEQNGSFTAQAPLIDVIGAAYDVPNPGPANALILGGPEWLRSNLYMIVAAPGNLTLPPWFPFRISRSEEGRCFKNAVRALWADP